MDTCFSLFTSSTSPYSSRRLGPRDRQTSAVLTYTLHLPRVCAVLSPVTPNRESSSTPPQKAYRLINPRYPPWNRGWCFCLSKSSPVFSTSLSPGCRSQQKKKGNSSCGQPTAATHSLPIQAVGGNHFRPLSLDPRRTSFDPHRSRSLPSLSLFLSASLTVAFRAPCFFSFAPPSRRLLSPQLVTTLFFADSVATAVWVWIPDPFRKLRVSSWPETHRCRLRSRPRSSMPAFPPPADITAQPPKKPRSGNGCWPTRSV